MFARANVPTSARIRARLVSRHDREDVKIRESWIATGRSGCGRTILKFVGDIRCYPVAPKFHDRESDRYINTPLFFRVVVAGLEKSSRLSPQRGGKKGCLHGGRVAAGGDWSEMEQSFEWSKSIFSRLNSEIRTSTSREECERVISRDAPMMRGWRRRRGRRGALLAEKYDADFFKRETAAEGKQLVQLVTLLVVLAVPEESGEGGGRRREKDSSSLLRSGRCNWKHMYRASSLQLFPLDETAVSIHSWKAAISLILHSRALQFTWMAGCRMYYKSIHAKCIISIIFTIIFVGRWMILSSFKSERTLFFTFYLGRMLTKRNIHLPDK